MFKRISEMQFKHQTIFAIIIGLAVISFWRGAWGLIDEYLFPDHYRLSLWASLILGIVILIATNYITKELM